MSTIPEALETRRLGMPTLGLAFISNAAAGLGPDKLAHAEVLAQSARMQGVLARLLQRIVREAPMKSSSDGA